MKENYCFLIPKWIRTKSIGKKPASGLATAFMFLSFLLAAPLQAQTEGETCNDPIVIETLPFDDSGNTGDYGNNYSAGSVPSTASGAVTDGTGAINYMDGPEVVYVITPIIDGTISISTTNVDGWVGLWAFTGCPFSSTVGYHTSISGATRTINNLPVTADETYYIVLSTWQSQLASTDFTIEISGSDGLLSPLEDCDEVIAGIVEGPEDICASTDFSLTVTNSTSSASDLTKQWQSSMDGENWEDIEGANGNNLSTSITEDTYFRFIITCEISDEEDISDAFLVEVKAANECYCIPTYTTGCSSNDNIVNVSLTGESNSLDNDSGCGSGHYTDYSEDSSVGVPDLAPGETYTLSVTTGYSSPASESFRAWIDYDQNGIFDDEEEIAYVHGMSSSGTSEVEFTVPEQVEAGTFRLRVRLVYGASASIVSCGSATYGEAEDYAVEIIQLEDCEGPVSAGEPNETELLVCGGNDFQVGVSGASDPANNLYRVWQSSPAGEDDWTDLDGLHANTVTIPGGVDEPTDFRYKVVCNDDESDYSDIIEVTLNPAEECYCVPSTNSTYYVSSFSTSNGEENIDNTITAAPANGYGDYTDQTVSQIKTYAVDFSGTMSSSTHGMKIWVDWNRDGNFDEDEIVYQSSSYSGSFSGNITVPESAVDGETIMRVGTHVTNSSGPATPCEDSTSTGIAYQDYTFEIIPLEDCEGTPDAGTVETDLAVCEGVDFHLVTVGATSPANNLVRTWQSSPAGEDDWTDIDDSQFSDFILIGGITEATDFRFKLQCEDGDIVYSDVIEATLKSAEECYCIPNTNNTSYYVNSFSTTNGEENISNTVSSSPSNGYGDFTNQKVKQIKTLSVDFSGTMSTSTAGMKIWVDWNKDGIFDSDEIVYQSSSYSASHSGTITVPETAATGETVMRIGTDYLGPAGPDTPCEESTNTYIAYQDYTFEVVPLEDCEGTPDAGTVDTELLVCAGIDFHLITEGASSPANNLFRTWQSSPAGEDDWTDIDDSHFSDFILIDGITEATDFRFKVQCNDGDIVYSDVIEATLKSAEECYCVPSTNTTSYYLSSFSTTGGEENIDNSVSSSPSNGYGDYTDQKVKQFKTLDVEFSGSMSTSTAGMKIWIDWNKDGVFDSNEIVYQSSSYSGTHSGTITVPETAVTGETIMRVGTHYLSSGGPDTPCEVSTSTYIAYQDFTFEVEDLDDCEGMPDAGELVEDSIYICAGEAFTLEVENTSEPGNNLYRRWQSSPAGENDWTDIDDSYYTSFTITDGVFEATDFRYAMTCNDEDSDYSDIIEVTLKPGTECYCTPTGSSNNSAEILNFTLDDFSNDSNPSEGTNGYSDYSDLGPITLIPGVGYVATITVGSDSGTHGAAIWIDYNDDGFFSEDEKVAYIGNTITAGSTVDFPEFIAGSEIGEHRLRVQYTYYQDGANLDPCNITSTYSETEDYTVLIVDVACFPPTGISIDYVTDNSAQVTWVANDESEWLVSYGSAGFDPETEGESMTVTEPLADITDLDDDTTYEVYVQTLCDVEDSVVIGPRSFTTNITPPVNTRLCDAIELIPNSGCVGGPYTNVAAFTEVNEPVGSCLNDYHGTKTVWFSFVATDTEAVVTTDFNSTDIQTEIVVFEAPDDCTDMTTLGEEIGCANAGSEGIIEIDGLTIGDTYYVKIAGFNNTTGLFCLEVQMDEVEVCLAPTDVTIGEIGDTFVDVSWTSAGSATQWEVLYGLAGFDTETEGDAVVVNSTEVTLTDLQPETDYEVYVRAICGDDNSDWTDPEPFTTDEMGVENQIFEDFSFYPNPVKEMLNLKAGSLIEKVEIYNLLGQKVLEVQPNNLESAIDTDKLQSGTYLMKVTIDGVNKSFRVIKK